MTEDKGIPEEILKEWVEKAKPLVDSTWNLAIDNAIGRIKEYQNSNLYGTIPEILHSIINSLTKLKK